MARSGLPICLFLLAYISQLIAAFNGIEVTSLKACAWSQHTGPGWNYCSFRPAETVYPSADHAAPAYTHYYGRFFLRWDIPYTLQWKSERTTPTRIGWYLDGARWELTVPAKQNTFNFTFNDLAVEVTKKYHNMTLLEVKALAASHHNTLEVIHDDGRYGASVGRQFHVLDKDLWQEVTWEFSGLRSQGAKDVTWKWKLGVGLGVGLGVPLLLVSMFFFGRIYEKRTARIQLE